MGDAGRKTDTGGNAETLGATGQERADGRCAHGSARELRGDLAGEGGRDVVGKADRQTVPDEDFLRERGEARAVGRPPGGKRGVRGLQVADLGETGQRVLDDAPGGELRGRAAERVAAAREPHGLALGRDAPLLEQVADGLRVREHGFQQDLGHEADDIGLPGLERRDGDGHVGAHVLRVAGLPVDGPADAEVSDLAVELVAQRVDRVSRRREVAQDARQHRQVGKLPGLQVGRVEVESEMQHAVRLGVGTHQRDAVQVDDFAGGHGSLHGHVLHGQQRQLRDVLGTVRRRLVLREGAAGREHLVQFLLRPGRLDLRELRLLGFAARGTEGRRRQHRQLGMVRIVQHGRAEQLLEPARLQLRAQRGVAARVAEGVRGIAAVEPQVVGVGEEREAARRAAVVLLAVMELGAVDQRREAGVVEALGDDARERLAHGTADRLDVLPLHVLDDERNAHLRLAADPEMHVLAEALLEQRLLQRRVVVAREGVRDHVHRHVLLARVEAGEDPGVGHQDLALGLLVGADLVLDRLRRRDGLLNHDRGVHLGARIGREEAVQLRQHGRQVDLAVQEDPRVRGMVEAVVEGLVLFEGQLGNRLRVAAGDEAVARVGVEQTQRLVAQQALGVRERALHLAVDDAVALQFTVRLVQLVVPALLLEGEGTLHAERMQDGVHVDVDEVEEVRRIARTDGIHRRIRAREGVEERRERTLQQVDERLLHGILFGAAEHGVLDDVRHARVVGGQRPEPDRERHVVVVAVEPGEIRPVLRVGHAHQPALHLGELGHALHREPAQRVAGLEGRRKGQGRGQRDRGNRLVHLFFLHLSVLPFHLSNVEGRGF